MVSVVFPVDCERAAFGFLHQTSSITLSFTPVPCGPIELPDPQNHPPHQMKRIINEEKKTTFCWLSLLVSAPLASLFQTCFLRKIHKYFTALCSELQAPNRSLCETSRVYVTALLCVKTHWTCRAADVSAASETPDTTLCCSSDHRHP